MTNSTFGQRLRKAIFNEGKLEKDFANEIGIDPTLLSKYLNDEREPAFHNLQSILAGLTCCRWDWLILGRRHSHD